MVVTITIALVFMIILLTHLYISSNFDYWKKRKIFYVQPIPIFGNFFKVVTFQTTIGIFLKEMYEKVDKPFFGIFMIRTPQLIIKDVNLAKNIMMNEFDRFQDRTLHCNPNDEISANLLICLKSMDWKIMRQKLTPFFSPGKLKNMINIHEIIAEEMIKYIDLHSEELEAKELCSKYAIELISRNAFGIEANCFENENAEIKRMGRLYFEFNAKTAFRFGLYDLMPGFAEFFHISLFNPEANNFMRKVLTESITTRQNNPIEGNDLIDLILELKGDEEFCKKQKFYGDKIIAQAIIFFTAGSETVSACISFTLYELAIHQNVQNKARQEIQKIYGIHKGLNYDCLQEMEYLEMVLSEVLRKYPSIPIVDRTCTRDYKIPGAETVIDQGTKIIIPIMGMHYDEKYFPNSDDFIPERFADKNDLPFAYMPFGQGPRKCIGYRLAMINAKVALCKILMNFEIMKTENTPIPIIFEPKSIMLASKDGLPLKFRRLKQK